ncbi:MAG: hypothetical protein HS113_07435 [Verrucomicrobiales bacterium]|nr:hypothetical protein [Verrucomicrobiales bacterium]
MKTPSLNSTRAPRSRCANTTAPCPDSLLTGNSSAGSGGSVSGGTLYNCILNDNRALRMHFFIAIIPGEGGGASGSVLYNCVLSGNEADHNGGGARNSTLYNYVLTGNSASGVFALLPLRFAPDARLGPDGFRFRVLGEPGRTVRVERSRDLRLWEALTTVPALPVSGQALLDAGAVGERLLFYRAVREP